MSESLAPGTRLGPYEIDDMIGAGGMGQVYRARDPRLNRHVAIKTLLTLGASDPDAVRRFETEAKAAGTLDHQNLLVVYDVGREGDVSYIVSELLEGETLRARLGSGPVPERQAIEYAAQIALGLTAAHERGIIHRDLKPENLFLTRDRRVKILDFGVAKLIRTSGADEPTAVVDTVTAPGVVVGTVGERCRAHTVRVGSPESSPRELPDATVLAISRSGELALALGSHFDGVVTYGTLARVPIAGGAPRQMVEDVKFADWSPDGSDLAIVRRADGRDRLEFPVGKVLVQPAAGEGTGLGFARISPDGRRRYGSKLAAGSDISFEAFTAFAPLQSPAHAGRP